MLGRAAPAGDERKIAGRRVRHVRQARAGELSSYRRRKKYGTRRMSGSAGGRRGVTV